MSIQGSANLQTQWNIVGEFSNLPQEELIEWIKYSTKPGKKQSIIFRSVFPKFCIPLLNPKPEELLIVLLFLSVLLLEYPETEKCHSYFSGLQRKSCAQLLRN